MGALIPQLPTGSAFYVFAACMAIGFFVIIKYCLDQFDKPIAEPADKVPWDFVRPHRPTSRQQYLTGFVIYCSIILFIFVVVSVVIGPGNFFVDHQCDQRGAHGDRSSGTVSQPHSQRPAGLSVVPPNHRLLHRGSGSQICPK